MNVQHSTGTPVRCTMSAIGRMSATSVRAAQFARIASRSSPIVRASRSASAATRRPGARQTDVRRVDAEPVHPRRMSIFSSIDGMRTDGDCSPSLSVSSSSITGGRTVPCSLFQSWMRGWRTEEDTGKVTTERRSSRRRASGTATRATDRARRRPRATRGGDRRVVAARIQSCIRRYGPPPSAATVAACTYRRPASTSTRSKTTFQTRNASTHQSATAEAGPRRWRVRDAPDSARLSFVLSCLRGSSSSCSSCLRVFVRFFVVS